MNERSSRHLRRILTRTGGLEERAYGGVRTVADPPVELTRADILRRLRTPLVRPLSRTVRNPDRAPLEGVVAAGLRRWVEAFHHESSAVQTLGLVTTMELLLGDRQAGFPGLKRRTRTLVGPDAYARYDGDRAIRTRNDFVHDGRFTASTEAVNRWIALAALTLLHVATVAPRFHGKPDLTSALDLLGQPAFDRARVAEAVSVRRLRSRLARPVTTTPIFRWAAPV